MVAAQLGGSPGALGTTNSGGAVVVEEVTLQWIWRFVPFMSVRS